MQRKPALAERVPFQPIGFVIDKRVLVHPIGLGGHRNHPDAAPLGVFFQAAFRRNLETQFQAAQFQRIQGIVLDFESFLIDARMAGNQVLDLYPHLVGARAHVQRELIRNKGPLARVKLLRRAQRQFLAVLQRLPRLRIVKRDRTPQLENGLFVRFRLAQAAWRNSIIYLNTRLAIGSPERRAIVVEIQKCLAAAGKIVLRHLPDAPVHYHRGRVLHHPAGPPQRAFVEFRRGHGREVELPTAQLVGKHHLDAPRDIRVYPGLPLDEGHEVPTRHLRAVLRQGDHVIVSIQRRHVRGGQGIVGQNGRSLLDLQGVRRFALIGTRRQFGRKVQAHLVHPANREYRPASHVRHAQRPVDIVCDALLDPLDGNRHGRRHPAGRRPVFRFAVSDIDLAAPVPRIRHLGKSGSRIPHAPIVLQLPLVHRSHQVRIPHRPEPHEVLPPYGRIIRGLPIGEELFPGCNQAHVLIQPAFFGRHP